jgi:hypothetical protein
MNDTQHTPVASRFQVVSGTGDGGQAKQAAEMADFRSNIELLAMPRYGKDGYIDWEATQRRFARVSAAGEPFLNRVCRQLRVKIEYGWKRGERLMPSLQGAILDFLSANFKSAGDARWYALNHNASEFALKKIRSSIEWAPFARNQYDFKERPSVLAKTWDANRVKRPLPKGADASTRALYEFATHFYDDYEADKRARQATGLPPPATLMAQVKDIEASWEAASVAPIATRSPLKSV